MLVEGTRTPNFGATATDLGIIERRVVRALRGPAGGRLDQLRQTAGDLDGASGAIPGEGLHRLLVIARSKARTD